MCSLACTVRRLSCFSFARSYSFTHLAGVSRREWVHDWNGWERVCVCVFMCVVCCTYIRRHTHSLHPRSLACILFHHEFYVVEKPFVDVATATTKRISKPKEMWEWLWFAFFSSQWCCWFFFFCCCSSLVLIHVITIGFRAFACVVGLFHMDHLFIYFFFYFAYFNFTHHHIKHFLIRSCYQWIGLVRVKRRKKR